MNGGIFGSGILDVAIGLALVYLAMSIMASAASEAINSALRFRAQGMEQFIRSLFMRPEIAERYTFGIVRNVLARFGAYSPTANAAERYVDHFYQNTLIAPTLEGRNRPAYIAARDFSLAVFDTVFRVPSPGTEKAHLLTTDDVPPFDPDADTSAQIAWSGADLKAWQDAILKLPDHAPLKPVLLSLLNRADHDLTRFRVDLESWFDSSMERVGGWYKRRTQVILLTLGIMIALLFNIDTIAIANRLLQNPALRSAIAEQATAQAEQFKALQAQQPAGTTPQQIIANSAAQFNATQVLLSSLNIPLGWTEDTLRDFYAQPGVLKNGLIVFGLAVQKLLGILITGFAVSQGAPFWFDLLNKLTNVRSAGRPPKSTAVDNASGAPKPAEPSPPK